MDKNKNELRIERIFDAPRDVVWRVWTDSEFVKKWWGPKDFTAPEVAIDFCKGGKYLYCMRGKVAPDMPERDYWSGGVFQEIVAMERIILTDYFADENGNQVSATYYGMDAKTPMEMMLTITFEDHETDKTKLTLYYPDRGDMSEVESEGMRQGWNQSLDKFADAIK